MPATWTPNGNYAQTLAYRALCASLRETQPKRRARPVAVEPLPFTPPRRKLDPRQDPITRKWITDRLPRSSYWQQEAASRKSYTKRAA